MPGANPLADVVYNSGQTSGMNSGTTQQHGAAGFTSGMSSGVADVSGGNANITVAALIGVSLLLLLGFHLLGFRSLVDVSVGRK